MRSLGVFLSLLVGLLCAPSSLADDGGHGAHGPREGRYFGYSKVGSSPMKIATILDLVVVQSTNEYMHMRATLRLLLGGFGSPEYITQYFESVSYGMESGLLVFEGSAQELALVDVMAHEMDGKFMVMGKIRSANGNAEGLIHLFLDEGNETPEILTKALFKTAEVVPALTGSYRGECGGVAQNLQLEAVKLNANDSVSQNPLLGYHIQGRFGEVNGNCSDGAYCTTAYYNSGSYNFYRNRLVLSGRPQPLVCETQHDGLLCGVCSYKKDAETVDGDTTYKQAVREFHVDGDPGASLPLMPSPKDISGTFHGYLHHTFTDRYQYMKLSVKGFMKLVAPHTEYLHASATAWLSFGEKESSEFISYKFDQREYRHTFPHFIFERRGDAQDGILQVTEWHENRILGIWYSKTFGRVGTVELVRDTVPDLNRDARRVPSLSGAYEGPYWHFNLVVMPGTISTSTMSFYPLQLAGTARIKNISALLSITGGSYDFYVDRLSFALDDRIVIGTPEDSGGMKLFWPGKPSWGIEMASPRLAEYAETAAGSPEHTGRRSK
ncbi:MAG: hypothetical protein KDD51_03185 [Bdellovibrionales bacterium]|nr:hypothetical protein [Bdellovibrionales bacterium]